jgi:hypothetical protein
LHGYGSIPTIEPSPRPTEKPPWTAVRTRAARHAKKAQHARRRQCHAKPPTQHTQPRACAQKTRTHWTAVRTRAARAICTIKHASTESMRTHSMRVDASATQSPPPSTHSHAHVPKKHAQIHLRRVWPNAHGPVLFPRCTPEHYARQLHGSGHTRPLASAKNIQETTPACMYKHGKSARVRWPRVPIGAVCAHTGDRATWVRRGSVV